MFWQKELKDNMTNSEKKSTASKETLNLLEPRGTGEMEREVIGNIVKEIKKGKVKALYKKYFKSKHARRRFEQFLDKSFKARLTSISKSMLNNYLSLINMKYTKNVHYDVESAIQCLDLAPLNHKQLDQALKLVTATYTEWCAPKSKKIPECDRAAHRLGFYLKKRKYENVKSIPSRTLGGLLDYEVEKTILSYQGDAKVKKINKRIIAEC
jgi:hypothetical protein